MSIPNNIARLTLQGTIGSPDAPLDFWSCNIHMAKRQPGQPDSPWTQGNANDWLDEKLETVTDWFGSTQARIRNNVWLTDVKLNPLGTDGKYLLPISIGTPVDVQGGSSGGGRLPAQSSMVLTFLTGIRRGDASHGRIYLPPQDLSVTDDFVIQNNQVQPMVEVMATFIRELRKSDAFPTEAFEPVVVSAKGTGTARTITEVRMDTRPDVQRRRANKISGTRFTGTV